MRKAAQLFASDFRLVREAELNARKSLCFYEWDGEEITKTVVKNDPHSEWMADLAAKHDLAKKLFGDEWRAKCGLLDLR